MMVSCHCATSLLLTPANTHAVLPIGEEEADTPINEIRGLSRLDVKIVSNVIGRKAMKTIYLGRALSLQSCEVTEDRVTKLQTIPPSI